MQLNNRVPVKHIKNPSLAKIVKKLPKKNKSDRYSSYGFIGTPQYAAPEQILRDSNHTEINIRTDIYAVDVTLYELITGKNPFKTEVEAEMLARLLTRKLPYDKKIRRNILVEIQYKENRLEKVYPVTIKRYTPVRSR